MPPSNAECQKNRSVGALREVWTFFSINVFKPFLLGDASKWISALSCGWTLAEGALPEFLLGTQGRHQPVHWKSFSIESKQFLSLRHFSLRAPNALRSPTHNCPNGSCSCSCRTLHGTEHSIHPPPAHLCLVLDRNVKFELSRKLILRVESVWEVNSADATVCMDLKRKSYLKMQQELLQILHPSKNALVFHSNQIIKFLQSSSWRTKSGRQRTIYLLDTISNLDLYSLYS